MAKVPKTSPIWRRASIEFSEARSTCFTATGELRSSCKSRCNSGARWFAVRNSASRGTRPAPNAIDHRYPPRRLLRARRPVLCATSVPRAIHPGAQQTVPQRFRDALLDRATAARWGRYGVMSRGFHSNRPSSTHGSIVCCARSSPCASGLGAPDINLFRHRLMSATSMSNAMPPNGSRPLPLHRRVVFPFSGFP